MDIQIPLWAAAITALSGLLGAVTGILAITRQGKRDKWEGEHAGKRTEADVTSALTASALALVNELQERVNSLHDRIKASEEECVDLKSKIREMGQEINDLQTMVRERNGMIAELELENCELRAKVAKLELRIAELENGYAGRHTDT